MTPSWAERRRGIVALSRSRRRLFRPAAPQVPIGLAQKHATLFERAIKPALIAFAKKAREITRTDATTPLITSIADLMVHYGDIISGDLTTLLGGMASSVSDHNAEQVNGTIQRVVGIEPADGPKVTAAMEASRVANASLIKGLSGDALERVLKALSDTQGMGSDAVTKALQEAVGFGVARARLIARDQTLKLNSSLTRARHSEAGITRYEWSTSHDGRVRSEHRELDGKEFSWDDPPVVDKKTGATAHPGEYFQCRCVAIPVIDLDAMEKNAPSAAPVVEPEPAPLPVFKPAPLPPPAPKKPVVKPFAPAPAPPPFHPHDPVTGKVKPFAWWGKPTSELSPSEWTEFRNKLTQTEQIAYEYETDGEKVPLLHVKRLREAGSTLFPHLTAEAAPAPVVAPPVAPTPVAVTPSKPYTWLGKKPTDFTFAEQMEYLDLPIEDQMVYSAVVTGKPVPNTFLEAARKNGSKLLPFLEPGKMPAPGSAPVAAPKPAAVPTPSAAFSWLGKKPGEFDKKEKAEFKKLSPTEQDTYTRVMAGKAVVPWQFKELKEANSKLLPFLEARAAAGVTAAPLVKVAMVGKVIDAPREVLSPAAAKLPKRDKAMAPKGPPQPSFDAMPVKKHVDGLPWEDHQARSRTTYPDNHLNKDYNAKVKAESKTIVASMPADHATAIEHYTLSGYASMNEYLRDGHDEYAKKKGGEGWANGEKKLVEQTKQAMAVLPKAPRTMVLFRGLQLKNDKAQMDSLAGGSELAIPSFGSFSRDPSVAISFAKPSEGHYSVVFRVLDHQNGVLVEGVSSHNENEVLFQPGTRFLIVGRQRVETNVLLVDLHEVIG